MIEVEKIHEGLEVVGSDGAHVGVVDGFTGQLIKLKKSDPASGGTHHFLDIALVAKVDDRVIALSVTAEEARQRWSPDRS